MVNKAMYSEDEDSQDEQYVNYKQKYRELKKNLRYLIYENECFQDELRKAQRNFANISRDKSFLLDRILKYEKPQPQTSDSEATESSDEDEEAKAPPATAHFLTQRKKITKRKKSEAEMQNGSVGGPSSSESPHQSMHGHVSGKQTPLRPIPVKPTSGKGSSGLKKPRKPPASRKPIVRKERDVKPEKSSHASAYNMKGYPVDNVHIASNEEMSRQELYDGVDYEFPNISSGHMTREEVERQLEARRFSPELNTTATVPAELFSHEPDPDSDVEDSEMCEYIQLEEDGQSADMMLD